MGVPVSMSVAAVAAVRYMTVYMPVSGALAMGRPATAVWPWSWSSRLRLELLMEQRLLL